MSSSTGTAAAQGGAQALASAGRSASPNAPPAAPAAMQVHDTPEEDAGANHEELADIQTLANEQAWPIALQVSATHVYWANWGGHLAGGIMRIPKRGGPAETLTTSQNGPNSLYLDDQFVYWLETRGSLQRAPVSGGSIELLESSADIHCWALGDDALYFSGLSGEQISMTPKAGGAATTIITPSDDSANTYPMLLRVHGSEVYWTQQATGVAGESTFSRLYRASAGGSSELVAEEQATTFGDVVFDADNVYWSVPEPYKPCVPGTPCTVRGVVRAKRLSGGEPQTIAGDEDSPRGLALDEKRVYWTTRTGIRAAHKDGSDVKTVVPVPTGNGAIAIDENAIYWAVYDEKGTIGRATKSW
jgi:sugar lactone lactonase YvrE